MGIGGAIDVAFIGDRAYVLVTLTGKVLRIDGVTRPPGDSPF